MRTYSRPGIMDKKANDAKRLPSRSTCLARVYKGRREAPALAGYF